jgi:hypothetical protein
MGGGLTVKVSPQSSGHRDVPSAIERLADLQKKGIARGEADHAGASGGATVSSFARLRKVSRRAASRVLVVTP